MASVNQTRQHCVNQMGKTHSKPLATRHGRGTAWAWHGHGMLRVNRPFHCILLGKSVENGLIKMHNVDNNVKFTSCKLKMFESRGLGKYLDLRPMKADPSGRAA